MFLKLCSVKFSSSKHIFQTEFWGNTGVVRINNKGERSDIDLEILQMGSNSELDAIKTVGYWTSRDGLMWRGEDIEMENGKLIILKISAN